MVMTAAIMSSCGSGSAPDTSQQSLMEASRQELAVALEERDQLLALVKEISEDMDQIKRLEGMMSISNSNPQENTRQRTRILNDIASIRKQIQLRRSQLGELEEKLKESTLAGDELLATVDILRRQIDSQLREIESLKGRLSSAEIQIGSLNSTVDSLNTTVSEVSLSRDSAREVSQALETELYTCFYVIAPKSELKAHGIIETGFLRKTRLMKGDFDKGFFTVADKRSLSSLPLGKSKPHILTNHPEGSFAISDTGEEKVLTITEHEKFWSLSNFLVIQQ